MGKFEQTTTIQRPLQEHSESSRAPSLHSDLWVPLGQAAFMAGTVATLVITLPIILDARMPFKRWAVIWLIPFLFTWLLAFIWRMGWAAGTIPKLERVTGIDLNRDGVTGEIDAHPMFNNAGERHKSDLQVVQETFEKFVNECYRGPDAHTVRALREQNWTDKEIEIYRQWIIDGHIAQWKSDKTHNDGIKLLVGLDAALVIVKRAEWLKGGPVFAR